MARSLRVMGGVLAAGCLFAGLVAGSAALSSRPPEIDAILEVREPESDLVLLQLTGRNLRRVLAARLEFPDGEPGGVLGVISPGGTTVKLSLPPAVEAGPYELVLTFGSPRAPEEIRFPLSVSGGSPLPESVLGVSLDVELASELEDAEALDGDDRAVYEDAGHYDAGMLPEERFSALADLVDEGYVVDGRFVPGLYSAWEDLEAEGAVVGGQLHVDRFDAWADLLAEGHRDGDGDLSTDHFSAWADLEDEGYLDANGRLDPSRFSAWESMKVRGWVDSSDHFGSALFDAWDDLVVEGKVGSGAGQVAAGNHDHDDRYVKLSGASTLTGDFSLIPSSAVEDYPLHLRSSASGSAALRIRSTCNQESTPVQCQAEGDTGSSGLVGEHTATSGKVFGVLVEDRVNTVFTYTLTRTFWGTDSEIGVLGTSRSPDGFGVFVKVPRLALHCVDSSWYASGKARTALQVRHSGSSGDIAAWQAGTTDKARIDRTGKGYFNGGIATSGADFAERVAVAGGAASLEAGDVLVIDPSTPRGFALSRDPASPLVAGVVSARPGVVAGLDPVAAVGSGPAADEAVLAIVGIVPVKVCDEGGAVEVGDLLVTSSVPGHARKAPPDPRPGTVLGKALGALEGGRGTVEVLLRLK